MYEIVLSVKAMIGRLSNRRRLSVYGRYPVKSIFGEGHQPFMSKKTGGSTMLNIHPRPFSSRSLALLHLERLLN